MKQEDKQIINAILRYIVSDTKLEKEIAKYVGKVEFDMIEDDFSDWISKVNVLD